MNGGSVQRELILIGVGELVVVGGPIAAGKSTVAAAVAALLQDAGLWAAVVELDEIVASLRAPEGHWQRSWEQARRAHAALVGGWLRSGVDVAVVDGPFHDSNEVALLLSEVPADTVTRWCWLDVAYDVARDRTAADPTRGLSRDPAFLRRAHDRVAALAAERPTPIWTFDTRVTPLESVVAAIADDLLASTASRSSD
jgi:predicted kinase